jgi:plastocyanin
LFVKNEQEDMCAVITVVSALVAIATSWTSSSVLTLNVKAADATNNDAIHRVQSGGGNSTAPLTVFIPKNIQVKAGESVTWDNPSTVGEPHTVTFVLDNKTMTNIVSAFTVPNSTQFAAIPPNSNNEPLKVPGQNNVVVAVNARSFVPTVIDSQGSVKHFAPPNAAYTMDGTEKYVNSGWLLPKGQEQDFPGSSTSFTVTFQKAGTYSYLCGLHPWMVGSVVVK